MPKAQFLKSPIMKFLPDSGICKVFDYRNLAVSIRTREYHKSLSLSEILHEPMLVRLSSGCSL